MKSSRLILSAAVVLAACGDHKPESSLEKAELLQDVRVTPYDLKEAQWSLRVVYDSENEDQIQKTSRFKQGSAKDFIQRIFDEGRFVLVANDQKLSIAVTPDGQFKEERDFSQNFSNDCKVTGGSKISGTATHIRLNLIWDWKAELTGKGCPVSAQEQFGAFIQGEMARLNLKSASDLFVGLDAEVGLSRSVVMRLELSGEINPEKIQTVGP